MECFGSLAGGWVRNFIITGFEYQTDVFIAWAGDPSQRCFTGTFQSFRSIFVSQLQKGQTTFICLFFNPIRVEDLLDHLMCCFTNTGCPFQKPCFILFAVWLMVEGHMFRDGGILSTTSIKPFVTADPISLVVNLNAVFGVPDIYLLAYILIRE